MANGLLIYYFETFHALYGFYAHTRINNPLRINSRDLLPKITSSLAPQKHDNLQQALPCKYTQQYSE